MKTMLAFLLCFTMFAGACSAELPSGDEGAIRKALASGRPTVVDFGARSCIPCKKMAPILEQLEKEYRGKANVIFIDVWQDNAIGGRYRIQMIPTQIFYDAQGKEVKRHMGFMDKPDIVAVLKGLGAR
jgi:thioredoxin 1